MMVVRLVKGLAVWLALVGMVGAAEVADVKGALPAAHSKAMGLLYSQEAIVQRLMAFRVADSPTFKEAGQDVLGDWQSRNANYMSLAPKLWEEARQAAIDSGDVAVWKVFESELWPEILSLTADVVVDSVRAEPKGVKRESKCTLVFGLINRGQFDIANQHAEQAVFEFLDAKLRARNSN